MDPRGQRILLSRAGIAAERPASLRALARTLRISVRREARAERAALRQLQTAARQRRCGRTPAWVQVPLGNRLVRVDPVLSNLSVTAHATPATASQAQQAAIRQGGATLLFALTAARAAVLSFTSES